MTRIFAPLAVLAAILLAAGPPAGAQNSGLEEEIQGNKQQLEDLQRQAEAKRRQVQKYRREEQGILERLEQADQAIAATRDVIRKMESREAELELEIRRQQERLSVAEKVLEDRRVALKQRVRFTYMHGRARSLEILLSADSFADILRRTAFLGRVLKQDEVLVHKVEDQQGEVAERLTGLKEKRDEIAALHEEKEGEEGEYRDLKEQRSHDLAKVQNQRAENERAVKELEEAARRLGSVLDDLERQRQAAIQRRNPVLEELDRIDFSKNRGRLSWPVSGTVITEFGRHKHPKYNTYTVSNGVDIQAPVGEGVHAVADGVVDLVQWLPGYGQTIILNHGRGYYTVYGHLSEVDVAEGARVEPGTRIGTVGETGSLVGPCLHFEVREKGEARDPRRWLR